MWNRLDSNTDHVREITFATALPYISASWRWTPPAMHKSMT